MKVILNLYYQDRVIQRLQIDLAANEAGKAYLAVNIDHAVNHDIIPAFIKAAIAAATEKETQPDENHH